MKLTKWLVKEFEKTQKQFGTESAIYNIYWLIAADIFRAAGVTDIKTRIRKLKV